MEKRTVFLEYSVGNLIFVFIRFGIQPDKKYTYTSEAKIERLYIAGKCVRNLLIKFKQKREAY